MFFPWMQGLFMIFVFDLVVLHMSPVSEYLKKSLGRMFALLTLDFKHFVNQQEYKLATISLKSVL